MRAGLAHVIKSWQVVRGGGGRPAGRSPPSACRLTWLIPSTVQRDGALCAGAGPAAAKDRDPHEVPGGAEINARARISCVQCLRGRAPAWQPGGAWLASQRAPAPGHCLQPVLLRTLGCPAPTCQSPSLCCRATRPSCSVTSSSSSRGAVPCCWRVAAGRAAGRRCRLVPLYILLFSASPLFRVAPSGHAARCSCCPLPLLLSSSNQPLQTALSTPSDHQQPLPRLRAPAATWPAVLLQSAVTS